MPLLGSVNLHSRTAVYEQLEILIQSSIAAGNIAPGDRLPSVRELSEQYEVNPNTIAKVYRDLEVMGVVYTRRGQGIFVEANAPAVCAKRCLARAAAHIYVAAQEAKAAGIAQGKLIDAVRAAYRLPSNPYADLPSEVMSALRD